jgi:SAM-dependent methyltransferase
MAEYDDWASIYDIVHSGLEGETDFYLNAASEAKGSVLELGCGTGRITVPIAAMGITIIGLDFSRPMLDQCSAKWADVQGAAPIADDKLELIHADMSAFELDRKFSLIIMPYRSFMHLLNFYEQLACLQCVAQHLDEDAQFIMNIWVPSAAYIYAYKAVSDEPEPTSIDTYQNRKDGGTIEHYHSVVCDEFAQQLREEHLFIAMDKDGGEVSRKRLPLTRTWIFVREMHNLIEASSLEVESVFGDFDRCPLTPNATESVWVLKLRTDQ